MARRVVLILNRKKWWWEKESVGSRVRRAWSRFVSRAQEILFAQLWCDHHWGKPKIEEHGERYRYQVTIKCLKCGRVDSYPE